MADEAVRCDQCNRTFQTGFSMGLNRLARCPHCLSLAYVEPVATKPKQRQQQQSQTPIRPEGTG